MNASEPTSVFVYGTLKPGESNYQNYCAPFVASVTTAIAFGQLYVLPCGYPAMTLGKNCVYGFLLSFNSCQVLSHLDELEDYDPRRTTAENEYQRCQIETYSQKLKFLGYAWAYLMTQEQICRYAGVPLPTGSWNST